VRFGLLGGVVLLAAVALAGYLYERHRTGNIYHAHARFVPQPAPKLPPGPDRFAWPIYGYTKNHTRFFPAQPNVRPPFKKIWAHNSNTLLEFPPVIYANHTFQLGDNGTLTALDKYTGKPFWIRSLGNLSASTPAVSSSSVYVTLMASGSREGGSGRIIALNIKDGRTRWFRDLSSPSESSPLLVGDKLFFGSQSGIVYAVNAKDGNVLWTYHAGGSVKASPTLSGGVLYFGDYSGHLQAVSAQTGRALWVSGSEGALLGSGTFYSTPAVVYGRVFLGNTDGRVYAYDASSGRLDWAVQTGAYVYSSPAVTEAPGLGPTVYIGSYDGNFYAFNARSGSIAWKFSAGGRISGSPTIIGRNVYFADLSDHRTYGLGISTGHVTFQFPSGSFDPVISDGRAIYLTGTSGLYELSPR
jgi:outer membrane protein assembly factor BamB